MNRLNDEQCAVLSALCDPEATTAGIDPFSVFTLDDLLRVAEVHCVSQIVERKLKAFSANASPRLQEALNAANEQMRIQAGVMLDLDFQGRKVMDALKGADIECRLVKGQTFANDLYSNQNDRPYTDIDIVVPAERLAEASALAVELGFLRIEKTAFDNSAIYQEIKLIWPGAKHILVELQGNLVHMRALRRVKKIGFPELKLAYDWETPYVGHFVVAVTHGSLSHKFHNLKLLVDCLQAMRRLRESDLPHLCKLTKQLNLGLEVATCLRLCRSIFDSDEVAAKHKLITEHLGLRNPLEIVRGEDVVQAPFAGWNQSRTRRHLFRLSQLV